MYFFNIKEVQAKPFVFWPTVFEFKESVTFNVRAAAPLIYSASTVHKFLMRCGQQILVYHSIELVCALITAFIALF